MKKETFDRLFDETITKKEYDVILKEINETIDEIVEYTLEILYPEKFSWHWDDITHINLLDEFIPVNGTVRFCLLLHKGIPTHYLWDDYKCLIKKEHIALLAKADKEKREYEEFLIKKKELRASIKSKLTEEELAVILDYLPIRFFN